MSWIFFKARCGSLSGVPVADVVWANYQDTFRHELYRDGSNEARGNPQDVRSSWRTPDV